MSDPVPTAQSTHTTPSRFSDQHRRLVRETLSRANVGSTLDEPVCQALEALMVIDWPHKPEVQKLMRRQVRAVLRILSPSLLSSAADLGTDLTSTLVAALVNTELGRPTAPATAQASDTTVQTTAFTFEVSAPADLIDTALALQGDVVALLVWLHGTATQSRPGVTVSVARQFPAGVTP